MSNVSRRHFLKSLGMAGVLGAGLSALPMGALRRAYAQSGAMLGTVTRVTRGPVTLHSYVAPEASAVVTTHIIETANRLVVIDAQFAQTFANEAAAYAKSLGKPIERHILSHEHPDHWLGANVWGDAPFVATEYVAGAVQKSLDAGSLKQYAGLLGDKEVPTTARVPAGTVKLGAETIDGVAFEIESVANAEAPEQLVIKLPEARTIIVQDLAFNGAHYFPGVDRVNWIATLEALRKLQGYDLVLVGHGLPTGVGELDNGINYLNYVNDLIAKGNKSEALVKALKARYPSFGANIVLGFWAQFLP
jgi:glyoxylase-like metal-dependent hydrolase (beta-lactamase superfamily II)